MKKLITLPEELDHILKEYKKKTGISVTGYIRKAIVRQMVHDKLITIRTRKVYVDRKTGEITVPKQNKTGEIDG